MGQEIDTTTTGQDSVAISGTISATVDTDGHSNTVSVIVDDNAGGAPASYSLVFECSTPDGNTIQYDSKTASTDRFKTADALPESVTVTLTNESGATADLRISVISHR